MQKIEGTTILLNRGDVLNLTLGIKDGDNDYEFQIGDEIKFSVYEKGKLDNEPVISKRFVIDEISTIAVINLSSIETKIGNYINKPVDYWYEVQLNNQYTVIGYDNQGPKIFKLFPEGYDV